MSKKDYIAIASIFARAIREYPEDKQAIEYLASELAGYCEQGNERFNRNLFLEACGIQHD